jgi:hypothetical protein
LIQIHFLWGKEKLGIEILFVSWCLLHERRMLSNYFNVRKAQQLEPILSNKAHNFSVLSHHIKSINKIKGHLLFNC